MSESEFDRYQVALDSAFAASGGKGRIENTVELYQAVCSFHAYMQKDSPDRDGAGVFEWLGPSILAHLETIIREQPKKSGAEAERDEFRHVIRRHLVQDLLDLDVSWDHVFDCAEVILEKRSHAARAKADAIKRSYYLYEPLPVSKQIAKGVPLEEAVEKARARRSAAPFRWDIPGIEYEPVKVSRSELQSDPDLREFL